MEDRQERISGLAREVLQLSRNTLLVNLRFLDSALSRLKPEENDQLSFATDGKTLAYDPMHVLQRYKADRALTVRDYLHVVLHCIYRHMFVHTLVDHEAWNLACDIAAEYSIASLGLRSTETAMQERQAAEFEKLKQIVGKLTAEKLYRYYLDRKLEPEKLAELRGLFYADDHRTWYMTDDEKRRLGLEKGEAGGDGQQNDGQQQARVRMPGSGDEDSETPDDGANTSDETDVPLGSEEDWKSISERIQLDMETFSKLQGDRAGGMMQNLRAVNRERYDYTDFLRRFAVRGEVMKINDEEFDYVFYTYGLKLYENMPLIEPLEYKEVKRIREFVIAIDTSGSTSGDLVQRFVQKTYNILKSEESFLKKINIHIVQCDDTIREDAKITSQEEFDNYLKMMKIHGLGGTDFRPVFGYVDWLIEKKEFENLKGLVYFTDGFGEFPKKKPDYETAFVFIDDEINNYDVPPWAIKLVLQKEEI